jgi:hypothetical protein
MSVHRNETSILQPQGRLRLRHPLVQLFAISCFACLFLSIRGNTLISIIGNYELSTTDLFVYGGLFVALKIVNAKTFYLNYQNILVIIFIAITFFNLSRGISENGLQALIALRVGILLPLALAFVFASPMTKSDIAMLVRLCLLLGLGLCLLVILRVLISPTLGFTDLGAAALEAMTSADASRVLWAPGAFLLGICSVTLLSDWSQVSGAMRRNYTLLSIVFFVCMLATRQLTAITAVTGAVLAYLAYGSVFGRDKRSVRLLMLLFGLGLAATLAVMALGISNLESMQQYANLRSGTGAWRQAVWLAIWRSVNEASLINQLIGFPSGSLPVNYVQLPKVGLIEWQFGAHSFYLESLRLYGWVGCALLLGLICFAFLNAFARPSPEKAMGFAFIIGFLVYGYGYSQFEGSVVILVLGLRLCIGSTRTRRRLA